MEFVLNRDLVVWAEDGTHTVKFEKGKPAFVPSKMKSAVMQIGAVPADDKTKEEVNKIEEDKNTGAPEDPEDRRNAIKAVLQDILERNDTKDFNANQRPKIATVRNAVGFNLDNAEVTPLWDELLQSVK